MCAFVKAHPCMLHQQEPFRAELACMPASLPSSSAAATPIQPEEVAGPKLDTNNTGLGVQNVRARGTAGCTVISAHCTTIKSMTAGQSETVGSAGSQSVPAGFRCDCAGDVCAPLWRVQARLKAEDRECSSSCCCNSLPVAPGRLRAAHSASPPL
jgi:hypothetical protein